MTIKVLKGDITKVSTDAIVNAANSSLMGGGGVDGAIHRAGGPEILKACMAIRNRQGTCKTGEAVITTAGNLPAKFVIHTVGPVWQSGNHQEDKKLDNCYTNSLNLAVDNKLTSIAFPNISTGIYKYPKEKAADVAIQAVLTFRAQRPNTINKVIFVCFDEKNFQLYQEYMNLASLRGCLEYMNPQSTCYSYSLF